MINKRFLRHDLRRSIAFPPTMIPLLSGGWVMAGLIAAIVTDIVLLMTAHLRLDVSWASVGFAAWAMAATMICYSFRARATPVQRVIRDLTEGLSLFALISLLGALASYPLAAEAHGFVDPALERIDLSLHFHWVTWYEMVADHAWVQPVERTAYLSIFFTPVLLLSYFAFSGRRAESRLFIATFWLAAVLTLALFPLVPAAGPFATLWHGAMPYMPLSALYQDQVILALRHHVIHDVDPGALHGLVCAPSFHAASAVLYIATAWRIKPLRWPITALNVAMLLATPVEGTHYLVDLVCGVLVALCALFCAPRLIRSTRPAPAMRGSALQPTVFIAAE